MSQTLLLQVSVGNTYGYVYRKEDSPQAQAAAKEFENVCMPSVRKYCEKHGYDYQLITEYPTDIDILFCNKSTKGTDYDYSGGGKNKCSTLIRYLNMDQDYDQIVTLDNDIWIPDWAQPLPEIKGHMAVQDRGKVWNAPHHGKFVNGGVQMVDRKTGKSLKEFVLDKCKKKIVPSPHTDQAYMNEWRSQNPLQSHVIDDKWNWMVDCHGRRFEYKDCNFVHYAGWGGRGIFVDDLAMGVIK